MIVVFGVTYIFYQTINLKKYQNIKNFSPKLCHFHHIISLKQQEHSIFASLDIAESPCLYPLLVSLKIMGMFYFCQSRYSGIALFVSSVSQSENSGNTLFLPV